MEIMQEDFAKIISATYKLLDFFPEGDPLKNKAKERVLVIVEKGVSVEDVQVLEDYLELAKNMGFVDNMNFLIIKKEWDAIKNAIFVKPLRPKHIAPKVALPKQVALQENYSSRQGKILSMLELKEKVQVQDIIKEMPKVTKRTIRRDMDDLLKKGKIKRIGQFNQVFYQLA